jgi:hypothetical protein
MDTDHISPHMDTDHISLRMDMDHMDRIHMVTARLDDVLGGDPSPGAFVLAIGVRSTVRVTVTGFGQQRSERKRRRETLER